jgi:hypothetical protein
MILIKPILTGKEVVEKMEKLSKLQKYQIIEELKMEGWKGSLEDDSLLQLANKVLEYQLKNE